MQCERTRAMSQQLRFYYWGLITKLRPTKGTQWIPAFAGMTVMCGCVSQLYVYRATMDESNFKDPIPACAGMTRSGERSGDLCHILRVLCADGIRENLKWGLAIILSDSCGTISDRNAEYKKLGIADKVCFPVIP